MGILGRDRQDNRQRAGTTVVASGTKLVGDLALSDSLHVDGHIEGKIRSESEVSIGQRGAIDGEVTAERIMISGRFEGRIEAERLEIAAGGRVEGEVTVDELVIESGAQFNGTSHIRKKEAPRQLGHTKVEPAEGKPAHAAKTA